MTLHLTTPTVLATLLIGLLIGLPGGIGRAPAAPAAPSDVPVDLELILAVDVSGSIDEAEAELQREGYVKAIAHPDIVAAIRGGMLGRIAVVYFEWSGVGWQGKVGDWTLIEDAASARAFSQALARAPIDSGPWTSISGAIDFAVPMFEANGYEGTRRVIDISGDGPNNVGGYVPRARDRAVARGIIINGLPIMNDRPNYVRLPMPNLDLYYRNCVIGGPGAFIVVTHDFKAFAAAIRRKLVLEIAGRSLPDGQLPQGPRRLALFHGRFPLSAPRDWIPPCDEGERRFQGIRFDEW